MRKFLSNLQKYQSIKNKIFRFYNKNCEWVIYSASRLLLKFKYRLTSLPGFMHSVIYHLYIFIRKNLSYSIKEKLRCLVKKVIKNQYNNLIFTLNYHKAKKHEVNKKYQLQPLLKLSEVDLLLKTKFNERAIKLKKYNKPIVSIIIPCYGKLNYTLALLLSISRYPPITPYEIILIDDFPGDNSYNLIKKNKSIRYFKNKRNLGYIKSINVGAKLAKGRFIYTLNNDTQVTSGWLDSLMETFVDFPGTGLVGSKLLYPDGSLQEAGGIIWRDGSAWNYGNKKNPNLPKYNYAREVDYCTGASNLILKKLFDSLGGLDEIYAPAYCDDCDISLKIRKNGYRVMYQPMSILFHFEGVTQGRDINQGVKAYQKINTEILYKRWKKRLEAHNLPGFDVDKAKDRIASKRALYLDLLTPTPDKDSGSIDAFNNMILLREMGFQITFIPTDNLAYMEIYTSKLQKNGIEVLTFPYIKSVEEHLYNSGNRYDLVILSRLETAKNFINLVKKFCKNAKTLFITVDLNFLRLKRMFELENNKNIKNVEIEKMRAAEIDTIKKCDISTVVSSYEYELLLKYVPKSKLRLLPYSREVSRKIRSFKDTKNIVFVGGFNHQPNIDAVNFFVFEIMPYLKKLIPSIKFYVVGSNIVDEIHLLKSKNIIIQGYVKNLSIFLSKFRIAVVPLRYGAGIKGKIGTSMSLGLPVVTTSVGAEGMGLNNNKNVIIEDKVDIFALKINKLYNNEKIWNKLSKNSFDYAEKNWSPDIGYKNFSLILKDLDFTIKNKSYPIKLYSD